MAAKLKSVPCSDWMRGWGYGYQKIGKLEKIGENKYRWKGHAQGRHGQITRRRWTTEFMYIDGIVDATDSLPHYEDVANAVNELNNNS